MCYGDADTVVQSGIFSTTFAMCMRGLGAYTKTGSILLTAATSGGAVVPAIMSPVTDHRGIQYSFCVVVAFFAFGSLLPIYTEIIPGAKAQVDPVREPSLSPDGQEEETVFGTANSRTRRGSAEGMAWVTAGLCFVSHFAQRWRLVFGDSCVT